MPIILAIEPDRRQRDALAAVVRQRVGAELILSDTTERALEAIGNRVPDLVLVPALLSPQDDAALAAALRVIAAAAHVRTLTIPLLAAHAAAAPSSGLLSRWRKGRSASPAPDGCDPAVFAEQISAYLKESAAERALMADDLENDVQGDEPQYAQEFRRDDVEPGASTYVQADAQAHQADVRDYDQPEVPAYVQPDMPYVQPDAQGDAQPGVVYTQPEMTAYAQPDPVYLPPEMQTYAQPDAVYVPPDMQAEVETELPTDSETDLRYSQLEMQPYSQDHVQSDVQEEVFGVVEGIDYDLDARSDGLTALRLNQEQDIDLSDELAVLEAEESVGMRSETSEMELFDGEPVGVYTMPSVIDEPDIDADVLAARRAFAEVEAAIEPASAAEAVALSEFEGEAVDPEFFAEPVFEAERRSEPVVESKAASARAYTYAADSIIPGEAKRQPSDAEPWISSFLSPRWTWPAMEGPPTEPPAAFVHVEAAVAAEAEARPAPAAHKRDRPEWSELVASLRKDIERRRVEPPQAKPKPDTQAPVQRRSRKSKPVQDEWGFFDPEQCGFAALLAKLDEITEGAEDKPVGEPSVHQSS
jgi:hypothetical protein